MKKLSVLYKTFFATLGIALACLVLDSCSKEINEFGVDWEALTPKNEDTASGNWKTCILANAAEIQLPAPTNPQSAQFLTEINEVKTAVNSQTEAQKSAIRYWSAGGVLRWNEIMRGLVAKYNLAPQENANDEYPVPNSANPFAYPMFPFANPPYAARAYAYVSVAQYDALVASYKLKSQYKQPRPYIFDASIVPSVPKVVSSSYPSEDAALATATLEILKFMFPTEIDFLTQKANEARQVEFWAGVATKRDIEGGDSLGRAIAAKVLARARGDNMRNAVGSKPQWDSLAQRRISVGETPWRSLETPARPPMLPFYGNVRTWLVTDIAAIRPPAPPATNSAEIRAQLDEVKSYADNPTRERVGIVHYWADGTGTHTPPGHWNAIAATYFQSEQMSEVRTARNFALLNMALMDAAIVCWETKTYYFYPRPSQLDPSIKTLTGLPNFPAYTSGHSTFSGAAATILGHILPAQKTYFEQQAEEASLSRLYGGIHYKMDCEVGLRAGKTVGNLAINRAKTDGAE